MMRDQDLDLNLIRETDRAPQINSHPLLKSKGNKFKLSAKKIMEKVPHNMKEKKMAIPTPSSEAADLHNTTTKEKMKACRRVFKDLRTKVYLRKGWSKSSKTSKTRKGPTVHRTTSLT
jgi:hypothetical protein